MLIKKMTNDKEIKTNVNLIISHLDNCDFKSIYNLIEDNNNAYKDYEKLLNKLDRSILACIMKQSIKDGNCKISTLLYTSKKSTHNFENEYFKLLKDSKSYKNIFELLNYFIKGYLNSTQNKEKYIQKFNGFADYLLTNFEDLKNQMFEECNKSFEHEYMDILYLIYKTSPKQFDSSKILDLYLELRLDFNSTPYLEFETNEI